MLSFGSLTLMCGGLLGWPGDQQEYGRYNDINDGEGAVTQISLRQQAWQPDNDEEEEDSLQQHPLDVDEQTDVRSTVPSPAYSNSIAA